MLAALREGCTSPCCTLKNTTHAAGSMWQAVRSSRDVGYESAGRNLASRVFHDPRDCFGEFGAPPMVLLMLLLLLLLLLLLYILLMLVLTIHSLLTCTTPDRLFHGVRQRCTYANCSLPFAISPTSHRYRHADYPSRVCACHPPPNTI